MLVPYQATFRGMIPLHSPVFFWALHMLGTSNLGPWNGNWIWTICIHMSFHQRWCHLATCGGNVVVAQEPRLECSPMLMRFEILIPWVRPEILPDFLEVHPSPEKDAVRVSSNFLGLAQIPFHFTTLLISLRWNALRKCVVDVYCQPMHSRFEMNIAKDHEALQVYKAHTGKHSKNRCIICFIGPLFTIARLVQINWLAMVYGIRWWMIMVNITIVVNGDCRVEQLL